MKRRRRGNLLLSALFMAAFLFFLSVALVVTNREDIRYTLFTDHKMRSNLAADGMVDWAVQHMRTNQGWETTLQTQHPPFASGAYASATWRPYSVLPAGNNGRFSLPSVDFTSGPAVELIVEATSGAFRSERHVVLEEFRIADSIANEGRKPHLFAIAGANVQVLSPTFKWEGLGPIQGGQPVAKSFCAGGYDLKGCTAEDGTPPPELKDFTKIEMPDGTVLPGAFGVSPKKIPRGQGAWLLELKGDKFSWKQLPDPGEQLGTVLQAKILPPDGASPLKDGGDPISKTWAELTLDWNIIARTPSELTVDYSYFNGPRVNWYSLTGTVAAAGKDKYYCHGRHYFYSGFRFKNTQQPEGQMLSQGKDNTLFDEPCLLVFEKEKWRVVVDYLKVGEDLWEEPTIVTGPQPDPSSMLYDPAKDMVYVKELGKDDPNWLQVADGEFKQSGVRGSRHLFFHKSVPIDRIERQRTPDLSKTLWGFTHHDIALYFPAWLPSRNELSPNGQLNTSGVEPKLKLHWDVPVDQQTSYGEDLYSTAELTCISEGLDGKRKEHQPNKVIAHFNGRFWQVLPAGLGMALPSSSYRAEMDMDSGAGVGPVGARLILGGYVSDAPLLRRYVTIARWGGN